MGTPFDLFDASHAEDADQSPMVQRAPLAARLMGRHGWRNLPGGGATLRSRPTPTAIFDLPVR